MIPNTGRLFALLLIGLASLAAHSTAEATEVSFCYWANYKDDEFVGFVCETFERDNPDVRIAREWYVTEYIRKLQLTLITQTAADIILMDDEVFPAFSTRGYLEDLRPYIMRESDPLERALAAELRHLEAPEAFPDYESPFLPTAFQAFSYRGLQGALPWDGNIMIMFYNKALFDAEGLPYPAPGWTWDDFRATAKRLTKDFNNDGRIDQFGFGNVTFDFVTFQLFLWGFGGDTLNADRTRSTIHEPEGIEAAQFVYDMMFEDHSIPYVAEVDGFPPEAQLLTGKVAMMPGGSYIMPTLHRAQDSMPWDVAHMPVGPRGHQATRVTWDGISINAHTTPEKKEIAWRFIKHYLSDEVQTLLASRQRGMPLRRELVMSEYIDPETPAHEEIAFEATQYARLTPVTPRYMEIREAMRTEAEPLTVAEITGLTVAEAFPRIEAKINAVLDKELADWAEQHSNRTRPASAGSSGLKAVLLTALIVLALTGLALLIPPFRRDVIHNIHDARDIFRSRLVRTEAVEGMLFASPWLLGLCLFTAFPILFSVVLSFSEWDPYQPVSTMQFVGLDNYAKAFSADKVTGDPLVRIALYNTFYYAFFAVPLGIATSLGLALLLNQKVRGITVFRTVFYLPSIVSGVATVILWIYIFNPTVGPLNTCLHSINVLLDKTPLAFINLPTPLWIGDPAWAKPALIIMSLWGAGGAAMLIFLAGLQGVPDQLYECARLDGAGRLRMFWNITLPMLTPTIYFNLIMGVIAALKVFMQAYVMTAQGTGGPSKALLFFVLHLFNKAFVEFDMGYASALAWILFTIIFAFTLLVIRSSDLWVYYEGERKR